MADDVTTSKNVKKESGMHGKVYERKILILISLKCLFNKEINDFWLLSNPVNVEKFDDVILLEEYKDGSRKLFMIQIKHRKKDSKPIVALKLDGNKDPNLSLEIYQKAFTEISCNQLFFNSNSISVDTETFYILYNNCQVTREIETDNLAFQSTPVSQYFDFIDSSSNAENVLKLVNKAGKYDEAFFKKIYFYTNQLNVHEVDAEITKCLGENSEIAEKIKFFFFKWADPENNTSEKLYKIDIKTHLLEIVAGDFHPPVPLASDIQNELMDIINVVDVTVISEEYSSKAIWKEILCAIRNFFQDDTIELSWEEPISKQIENKMTCSCFRYSKDFLANRKGLNINFTMKVLFFLMVSLSKIPFFIRTNNRLFDTFRTYLLPLLNIKVVVFNVTKETLNFGDLNVCTTLNCISNQLYVEKSNKIKISFQGKAETDLYLLSGKDYTNIKKTMSIDHLAELLHKTFEIGESNILPEYYMNRQLRLPILKHTVLKEEEPMFIIINLMHNKKEMKNYVTLDLMDYLTDYSTLTEYGEYNILTSKFNIDTSLKLVKEKIKNKKIYLLKALSYSDDLLFYLVYTNGSIDILRPHLTVITEKDEHLIDIFDDFKVNIICNNAGMGKSTFLNFLYINFPPEEWVVHLELGKYSQSIKDVRTIDQLFDFVFQHQCKTVNPKLNVFFKVLYNHLKNKIILLLDDYEEVNQPHLLSIFREAVKKGVRICIVARPFLKIEFENTFNVFSMELTEFSRDDQNNFFQKYLLQKNKRQHDIEKIINAIDKTRHLLEDSFIGICQQTVMLAEIFLNNDGISKKELHRIDDLYEEFINVKVTEYSEIDKNFYIRTISKLALKVFFTDTALARIVDLEECMQDVDAFKNKYPKDFFVSGYEGNEFPVFSHRTYAEFLTARWLVHTMNKQKNRETPSDVKDILKMLYFKELTTVRLFFDNMLTKRLRIHSFIVNQQISRIKNIKRFFVGTDLLGRSVIHLASSYGKRYEIQTATEKNGLLRNVEEHAQVKRSGESILLDFPMVSTDPDKVNTIDQIEVIDECLDVTCLGSIYEIFEKDTFLNLLPADCALLSGSLLQLNILLKYHAKENNQTFALQQKISKDCEYFLLYHSIQNGFNNILAQIDTSGINNIKVSPSNMSLLHLAVASKNVHAVRELIQKIKIAEWGTDIEGNTPLHLACEQKSDSVLKTLLGLSETNTQFLNLKNNKGYCHLHFLAQRGHTLWIHKILLDHADIDVDAQCNDGNTPFIFSIIYRKIDSAKILYNYGADVNHKNKKNNTALHYSSSKGILNCTKYLIKCNSDVNCKDVYGLTPLMKASTWGHVNTAKFLLKNDAEVNMIDKKNWTALHYAIRRNKVKIVSLLLTHKANVNSITDKGLTPLMMACLHNVPRAVALLIENGAKINIISNENRNALNFAFSKKFYICADLLLQAGATI